MRGGGAARLAVLLALAGELVDRLTFLWPVGTRVREVGSRVTLSLGEIIVLVKFEGVKY